MTTIRELPESLTCRFLAGTTDSIRAVLSPNEPMANFLRFAVTLELERRKDMIQRKGATP
jgi:hypothetical protein